MGVKIHHVDRGWQKIGKNADFLFTQPPFSQERKIYGASISLLLNKICKLNQHSPQTLSTGALLRLPCFTNPEGQSLPDRSTKSALKSKLAYFPQTKHMLWYNIFKETSARALCKWSVLPAISFLESSVVTA